MVKTSKKVLLINASPKIGESTASDALIDLQEGHMQASGLLYERLNVRQCFTKKTAESAFVAMAEADALVFTFPLYFFCLPGMLQRFLQDYHQFQSQRRDVTRQPRVYAVVNCGFPEASINTEAVRVIKSFCEKIGAQFRFGVMIGAGPMLISAPNVPPMKKSFAVLNSAFQTIAHDIGDDVQISMANISIEMNLPRRLYLFAGNQTWIKDARGNGLKKKDLYRKPYLSD